MLVLIVGCLGLASNIVGLFLFHDHGHGGHSHGGHSHGAEDGVSHAEEGHAGHVHPDDAQAADESGNVADVLPQNRIADWPQTKGKGSGDSPSEESDNTAVDENGGLDVQKTSSGQRQSKRKHSRSRSRTFSSVEDMPVNASSIRRSIIEAGRLEDINSEGSTDDDDADQDAAVAPETPGRASEEPLIGGNRGSKNYGSIPRQRRSIDHKAHKHAQPSTEDGGHGHGHSHGDLNMRGVFLHVMGDALGNIGVIASALFIWLTTWSWRFYTDPAISLIITVIILCSAIPLCKAASRILLQAVPPGMSVDDIQDDIEQLSGIVSCHHLHVWQLSDTKLVASLHVQVDFDFQNKGSARYMKLARDIRTCLHGYGIHSSTIQPEFCLDPNHEHAAPVSDEGQSSDSHDGPANGDATNSKSVSKKASKATSLRGDADACLLDCDDACGDDSNCCAPAAPKDRPQE